MLTHLDGIINAAICIDNGDALRRETDREKWLKEFEELAEKLPSVDLNVKIPLTPLADVVSGVSARLDVKFDLRNTLTLSLHGIRVLIRYYDEQRIKKIARTFKQLTPLRRRELELATARALAWRFQWPLLRAKRYDWEVFADKLAKCCAHRLVTNLVKNNGNSEAQYSWRAWMRTDWHAGPPLERVFLECATRGRFNENEEDHKVEFDWPEGVESKQVTVKKVIEKSLFLVDGKVHYHKSRNKLGYGFINISESERELFQYQRGFPKLQDAGNLQPKSETLANAADPWYGRAPPAQNDVARLHKQPYENTAGTNWQTVGTVVKVAVYGGAALLL